MREVSTFERLVRTFGLMVDVIRCGSSGFPNSHCTLLDLSSQYNHRTLPPDAYYVTIRQPIVSGKLTDTSWSSFSASSPTPPASPSTCASSSSS